MTPFPKTGREVMPYLKMHATRSKRFILKNRNVVIGVCALMMVGVVVSAFALSGDDGRGKRIVPYAAKTEPIKAQTAKTAAKPTMAKIAKSDPMTAGRALLDAKKYDQAIDAFQPLVDDNVEARFFLGKAHLGAGNSFRGCRQLTKYVEMAPKGRFVKAAKTSLKGC